MTNRKRSESGPEIPAPAATGNNLAVIDAERKRYLNLGDNPRLRAGECGCADVHEMKYDFVDSLVF